MELHSHTVLITGGASGIGLGFAEKFIQAGSTVIVCGRREEKLREAKAQYPVLNTRVCDLEKASERIALADWITSEFPALDVLVNNAGIQNRMQLRDADWKDVEKELSINLDAPLHLAMLFIPHLLKNKNSAIINISSGLAFVPLAIAPVYSATKAAIHSFTLSLRHQLASTPISVIEVIPPALNTDLGGKGLHTTAMSVGEFINVAVDQLQNGSIEVSYSFSAQSSRASREELDAIFNRMNQNR
jgi:uncharacterized oxidoreductase